MKRNKVIITAIQGEVDTSYKMFCIATWDYWAKKNNVDVILIEDAIPGLQKLKPTWQRWYTLQLLEENNIEYNQVALVDVDTMIHWEAPNFFEETNNRISACIDNDNVGWVLESIKGYSRFFPNITLDWTSYFNCGMVVINESHKELCNSILKFRMDNDEILTSLQKTLRKGTDQTPVNYLVKDNGFEINLLNKKWNLTHLNRKELLNKFMFIEAGWVWHFNGFDKNQRFHLMNETWNYIKDKYGY